MVDTILIDTLFVIKGMFGACGAAMLCCLCVVAGGQIGKKSPPPGTERNGRGCYQSFKIKCGNVADWKIVLLTATFQSGNSAWSSAALLVAMLSLFSKVLQAP
jgi:hypothetical protein